MKFISTGFQNRAGDRGDAILHDLETEDWVIAYANRYGAIGAGVVGPEDSYRLARRSQLPPGWESRHRHLRAVKWVYYVESLADAVPFADLRLPGRRLQTKNKLTSTNGRR